MPDQLGGILPERASHRLLVAYALAIAGILAVGDGLDVISFPMYQLGLPDTTLVNAVVALGGIAVFAAAYRLAMGTIAGSAETSGSEFVAYGEAEPVRILKERYARGDLSDEEFDHRLDRLADSDSVDFDPDDRQTLVEETGAGGDSGLIDRKTAIE